MAQSTRLRDLQGMTNGLCIVLRSFVDLNKSKCQTFINTSYINKDLEHLKLSVENVFSSSVSSAKSAASGAGPEESLKKLAKKTETFIRQASVLAQSNAFSNSGLLSSLFNASPFSQTRKYHSISNDFVHFTNKKHYLTNKMYSSATPTLDVDPKAALKTEKKPGDPKPPKFEYKVSCCLAKRIIIVREDY